MHATISPSPTGNLDRATIAAFWAAVRAYDGLSRLDLPHSIDLGGCSGCKRGIVQRVLTAEAQRELLARKPRLSGYAYEPVNGSSHVPAVPGSKIPQGTDTTFEKDMGMTIGVDANGKPTSILRASFDSDGRLKSAYPIK